MSQETVKEEIERLKIELQRQHLRRQELRRVIAEEEVTTSLTKIISNSLNGSTGMNDKALEDFQERLVQDIIAGCKERQITELQTYYRLSGRTIFPVKDHHVGIRFETFYGGKYHEPYYLILKMDIPTDQLVIAKHTIPHFIPLRSLEKRYLNSNMETLTKSLDDHLQAYISRREQVKTLRAEQQGKHVVVMANAAFSFIEVVAEFTDKFVGKHGVTIAILNWPIADLLHAYRTIQINLIYDSLTATRPTRLTILQQMDAADEEEAAEEAAEEGIPERRKRRLKEKEAAFRELRLSKAFERVFGEKPEQWDAQDDEDGET
ncbi:Cenp-O kinetochore centromere component-domain-containing protein, partial [Jimgerdemannia flammicorona]